MTIRMRRPPPTEAERTVRGDAIAGAPPHVAGDYPEWLDASFTRVWRCAARDEGARRARPPIWREYEPRAKS